MKNKKQKTTETGRRLIRIERYCIGFTSSHVSHLTSHITTYDR